MRELNELYRTPEGTYAVRPAPTGYDVVHVPSGACICWCERLDTARAYAESRELFDAAGL